MRGVEYNVVRAAPPAPYQTAIPNRPAAPSKPLLYCTRPEKPQPAPPAVTMSPIIAARQPAAPPCATLLLILTLLILSPERSASHRDESKASFVPSCSCRSLHFESFCFQIPSRSPVARAFRIRFPLERVAALLAFVPRAFRHDMSSSDTEYIFPALGRASRFAGAGGPWRSRRQCPGLQPPPPPGAPSKS